MFGRMDMGNTDREPRSQIIIVSALDPLLADCPAIHGQTFLISFPHLNGGMILPTITRLCKRQIYLFGFGALLSQTPPIKRDGRLDKTGIWEKCLHELLLSVNVFRI